MENLHQYIEQFHLLFLEQLGRKIDKRLYALKGGCNLRFYFKSIRYSEDIDLDVQTIRKDTLKKNVQNILESPTFKRILQTRNIAITNITTPKQTDTTQRWKISALAGRSITQARDVFDLYLLLNEKSALTQKKYLATAIHNLASISFQDFNSQVVAYLATEYQTQYATKETWEHIVKTVNQNLMQGLS